VSIKGNDLKLPPQERSPRESIVEGGFGWGKRTEDKAIEGWKGCALLRSREKKDKEGRIERTYP